MKLDLKTHTLTGWMSIYNTCVSTHFFWWWLNIFRLNNCLTSALWLNVINEFWKIQPWLNKLCFPTLKKSFRGGLVSHRVISNTATPYNCPQFPVVVHSKIIIFFIYFHAEKRQKWYLGIWLWKFHKKIYFLFTILVLVTVKYIKP